MVKLIVADSMQLYGRIRRDHKIQCRPGWPAIYERSREPAGRNSLLTNKCHTHKSARGVRLQFQELSNFLGIEITLHLIFLRLEHRLATTERPMSSHLNGHQTSDVKNQRSQRRHRCNRGRRKNWR